MGALERIERERHVLADAVVCAFLGFFLPSERLALGLTTWFGPAA